MDTKTCDALPMQAPMPPFPLAKKRTDYYTTVTIMSDVISIHLIHLKCSTWVKMKCDRATLKINPTWPFINTVECDIKAL